MVDLHECALIANRLFLQRGKQLQDAILSLWIRAQRLQRDRLLITVWRSPTGCHIFVRHFGTMIVANLRAWVWVHIRKTCDGRLRWIRSERKHVQARENSSKQKSKQGNERKGKSERDSKSESQREKKSTGKKRANVSKKESESVRCCAYDHFINPRVRTITDESHRKAEDQILCRFILNANWVISIEVYSSFVASNT